MADRTEPDGMGAPGPGHGADTPPATSASASPASVEGDAAAEGGRPVDEGRDLSARAPGLGMSIAAVAVLVVLIATTVVLFGTDATSGPLQVALLTSAVIVGLLALSLGHQTTAISGAVVGGVSSAMGAIFILLAVGALIGTWNMAGTIPTVVYYGLGILSPTFFYFSTVLICGVVGLTIGSSWTTAATLGVAFVALAPLLGADPVITAGAVISGAYFGDKMTPLSETTVLVPSMVGGVTVNQHVGAMVYSSGPAIVIAALAFALLGILGTPAAVAFDPTQAQATLASEFNITPLNLLPLVILVILSIRKVPSFLSIFACALFAGVLAMFTQPDLIRAFVGGDAGTAVTNIKALYSAMANGFISNTGVAQIDELFSRGGMSSMLGTIWLVLGALSYAAVMEHAGFLGRLIAPIVARARSTGALIAAVVGTSIGLNILAGDQYVAIVMPSRVYRAEFRRRRIAPRVLSRTVEDSGTVTSPLVPWNSCGAYMAGVLGVATLSYLPYCFFNLLSPVISLIYGFTGFRIEHLAVPEGEGVDATTPAAGSAPVHP
jgi:NhaC family Na+:H+ antiporter